MVKVFLILLVVPSIVCPIINYTYVFLSLKFKFHKAFVKWLMTDGDYSVFITPFMSQAITFFIVMYLFYRVLLRPLYYLLVTLPTNGFDWLSEILFKPIKKIQFINELDDKKHI